MKGDMNDLKKLVLDMIQSGGDSYTVSESNSRVIRNLFRESSEG
jgi:hypothetical protein